jgi:hypothetical protein
MRTRSVVLLLGVFLLIAPALRAQTDGGPSVQRVYRFALEAGRISLEAIEDVRGDFRTRRHSDQHEAGMLRFRLLNSRNQTLAEEVILAPDYVCLVLDQNTSPDGRAIATRFTPPGPLVFQVRLPVRDDATVMKIYRAQSAARNPADAAPAEALVATIPLDKR